MWEQWRSIAEHKDYEVSDHGRVRSIDRVIETATGPQRRAGRVLVAHPTPKGYLRERFEGGQHRVHLLVLNAFVGPCPPGMEALHADDDPANNRLNNLSWDTRSANTYGQVRRGTHFQARKTHCPADHEYARFGIINPWSKARRCLACYPLHPSAIARWQALAEPK